MVGQEEGRGQARWVANSLEFFTGPLDGWLDDQPDPSLVRASFPALTACMRKLIIILNAMLKHGERRDPWQHILAGI